MEGYFILLFFSRYFGIFLKKSLLEAGGAQDTKRYLPHNRCYFLHPSSTSCMHQGFKALKSSEVNKKTAGTAVGMSKHT